MKLGLTKAAVLLAVLPAFAFNVLVDAQRGGRGVPAAPPTPRAPRPSIYRSMGVAHHRGLAAASVHAGEGRLRSAAAVAARRGRSPTAGIRRETKPPANSARRMAPLGSCGCPRGYASPGRTTRRCKLETDAGTQTRTFYFGAPQGSGGDWQGVSSATWDAPAGTVRRSRRWTRRLVDRSRSSPHA